MNNSGWILRAWSDILQTWRRRPGKLLNAQRVFLKSSPGSYGHGYFPVLTYRPPYLMLQRLIHIVVAGTFPWDRASRTSYAIV